MRKILALVFGVLFFLSPILSEQRANAALKTIKFSGCKVTSTSPAAPTDLIRMIDRITIDTKDSQGRYQLTEGKTVNVWISRDPTKLGTGIGKDNSQYPYTISGGQFSIEKLNSSGIVFGREAGFFEVGKYYLSITDPGVSFESDTAYCRAEFDVFPGTSGGSCTPNPGNPPGRLTPNDTIYVSVPDIDKAGSAYQDPNKRVDVVIATDKNGNNRVGKARTCRTVSELKKGADANGNKGSSLGYTLDPLAKREFYYILIKSSCESEILANTETGLCVGGGFNVSAEGGEKRGESSCKICIPPATWDGTSCVGGEADKTSSTEIICSAPFECADNGVGCKLTGASISHTYSTGPSRLFEACPGGYDAKGNCPEVPTGLGFGLGTSAANIGKGLLGLLLTIGGAVAFIIIIITGYRLMTSQGDPEKIKGAREQLTAAIVGLVFIIFSIAILSFLGVNVLQIPGLGQ